jgi:subtilisin family serine protease
VKISLSPRISVITLGLLVTAVGLAACATDFGVEDSAAPPIAGGTTASQSKPFVAGEIIIGFKAGASDADKSRARGKANAAHKDAISADLEVASLPPGLALQAAADALLEDSAVAFAEPNYTVQHMGFPDGIDTSDPRFEANLWGLHNEGQLINADAPSSRKIAYRGATGTNDVDMDLPVGSAPALDDSKKVYVGIIDEGIDWSHPDLAGVVGNPGEAGAFCNDGVDNDGNGKIDDCYGWDFAGANKSVFDGTAADSIDHHGTHVSGTIAARSTDGRGIRGVATNVGLISGKFLGSSGGTTANAIASVNYFKDLKNRGVKVVATNNSWGGGGFSEGLYNAIAASSDILFVAAAGNETNNNDATPSYPCSYGRKQKLPDRFVKGKIIIGATYEALPNVICVAAHDQNGQMGAESAAYFSNWGAVTVDVSAPGTNILSTIPFGKYAFYRGTSMATPHVTGLVALLASEGVAISDIKQRIRGTVVPQPVATRPTNTNGRVNAWRALNNSSTIDP